MQLQYSILNFDKTTDYLCETYQYWIMLYGECNISCEEDAFSLISHDFLELPVGYRLHIVPKVPVSVGCIRLTDFLATNTKIQQL